MTDSELRAIIREKGKQAALDALMSMPMNEYPSALIHELQSASKRYGMSGGVISDTAEQYIEDLSKQD